ncbi:glycosyltransferase family 39 protein [Pedobacter sp. Leaf170]|uniref:glycosyltransferase family 39 protein n=1 Tax=Pedobacter sp. Leaf170 TaxID=2876558 RepID=UPI001E5A8321|nr:glycosyltransferase family 39 protein [Pedobacter sp. Leaf170]
MLLLKKELNNYKLVDWLIVLVVFLGTSLRLFHYIADRSLWLDEDYLVSSLLRFDYKQLIGKPLDYQQKAPIGFLLVVKFFLKLLGNSQYSLRILPLLTGILSIFVFIPVAKFFLKKWGLFISIAIICLSPAFIYHSVEIKQYSTELLCSILAFYVILRFKNLENISDSIILSFSGAILLWFSYSSVFILGGIGIGLSLYYMITKQWRLLFKSFIPFFTWLISFITLFFLFINKTPDAEWVVTWFRFYDNFMPLPPKSLSELKWFFTSFYRMLDYPLGLLWNFASDGGDGHLLNIIVKMPWIPLTLILGGIYCCFKSSKEYFFLLITPLLLVFLASGLEYYPLTERFWLFIAPIFIIFVGICIDNINSGKKTKLLKITLVVLLLISPCIQSFKSVEDESTFYVHKKSYQKEIFNMVNSEYKDGDAVYVYWNELSGYNVFEKLNKYKFYAIKGRDFRGISKNLADYNVNLTQDFNKFKKKKRVWVIFNNRYLSNVGDPINIPKWYYNNKSVPAENLRSQLSKTGKIIKSVETLDISVYLFKIE